MSLLAEATEITVREQQVRIAEAEAGAALARVIRMKTTDARQKLRFGPGVTCEQIARVLDKALVRAENSGLDAANLVIAAGRATAADDIVRIRRKAHGVADWITSATSDIVIALRPAGIAAVLDEPEPTPTAAASGHPKIERTAESEAELAIREALYDVIDPDLGVNVVDLGFVRHVHLDDSVATITMTLTSAACPLTEVMARNVDAVLEGTDVRAELDWEWVPCWSPKDISEDGRDQLRAIGFNAF